MALSFVPSSFIGSINGFLSTWASVVLAAYFLRLTRSPRDLLPVPSAEPPDEVGGAYATTYHAAAGSSDTPEAFPSTVIHSGLGLDGTWASKSAHAAEPQPRMGPSATESFRHTPGLPQVQLAACLRRAGGQDDGS